MAIHYHYDTFPPASLEWSALIPLLGPTRAAIARSDGALFTELLNLTEGRQCF